MDPTTGLPDADELVASIDSMIRNGQRMAVIVVELHGYNELAASTPLAAEGALADVGRRLGRLTRGADPLALIAPGRFGIVASDADQWIADKLVERIRGVFALPVDVGDEAVSFPVSCGVAIPVGTLGATELLAQATDELQRILDSGES